jgi:hypothetical protein
MENEKIVIESKKWFDDAIELVRNYNFKLIDVVRDRHDFHCQFCGTAIVYVAIIEGTPMHAETNIPVVSKIGCDCVERVLGKTWLYFNRMTERLKDLKALTAMENRQEKYALEYAKEIEYLSVFGDESKGWNYETRFLIDVRRTLLTGNRVMTKPMINYLQNLIKRDVLKNIQRQLTADKFQIADWSARIASLLMMIEKAVGAKIHVKGSDYELTNCLLNYLNNYRELSKGQMELLNRKYEYYSERVSA